jgi:hypothetical protein
MALKLDIQKYLPEHFRKTITSIRNDAWFSTPETFRRLVKFIRILRPVTKLIGPQYNPNHYKIEIDITYKCNLSCYQCNRSSSQAPSSEV